MNKENYSLYNLLYDILYNIGVIFILVTWIAGIVIAKGFWSTLFSFFPFYAWYLVIELLLHKYGFLT